MKILINNYTFNSTTKQIALTDYTSVDLEAFLLVTNVTDNIIIYNFADPTKGGTVSGNSLTLDFDTTSMSNTDDLQIFIEDGTSPASNEAIEESNELLSAIYNRTESLAVVDTAQRQRVAVEIMPTVTVNGNNSNFQAVDTNNVNAFNINSAASFARMYAVPDIWRTIEMARQSYQQCIRANLTF
jgi:hypothetical protein